MNENGMYAISEFQYIMKKSQLEDIDEPLLWNMMTQGNEKAFEVLYSRYYDSMFYYGSRYRFDRSLIEDCIQDVFVYIFNNRTLGSVQYIQAYLLRSLRNRLLGQLSLQKNDSLEEIPFELTIEDSMFEELFPKDDGELKVGKRLVAILQTLTEKQKNVLYLRYVKGLTFNEISVILNVNSQSVQNQLSRMLFGLRNRFSAEE